MTDPLRDADRLSSVRDALDSSDATGDIDALLSLAGRLIGVEVGLVSIVDDEHQHFVAQFGLSEPWAKTGTPLSHSFCQWVVVDDNALVVSDARSDDRLAGNGAIDDLGVVAYCGVPIRDDEGRVLGSFCAIDGEPREWSSDDVEVLQTLASGVSSRLTLENRYRSLVFDLQRSLVPSVSDDVGQWNVDATYRPSQGSGVGGDFFDIQPDRDGSLWLVIGDVVGHGVSATVAMAQLQSAARTALTMSKDLLDAADVLDRVAPRLAGVPHAALAMAHFAADGRSVDYLCCGFLPPLVVTGDTARFHEDGLSAPLGRVRGRTAATIDLDDVDGIVFATDGLVERRRESIDVGLGRLADAAPRLLRTAEPANSLADQLAPETDDDLAVLVVRPQPR